MSAPSVSRGLFIGKIARGERKKVGDSDLVEFFLEDLGLRFNAWKDLSNAVPPPGSNVLVEGTIKSRTYQVEGKDRTTTEVTVSVVEALDGAARIEPTPQPVAAPAQPTGAQLPSGGF